MDGMGTCSTLVAQARLIFISRVAYCSVVVSKTCLPKLMNSLEPMHFFLYQKHVDFYAD
jgi:hypothetical protein